LPRIFDRLYRADPARSQHPDGAGLGLAIVKSIMALHGGTVGVESEVGKGSRFTLIFPNTPAITLAT
jgi:signal transduction histidine kinase